ncbi:MAG: PfkB family carbohydrate kinase [Chloroflexota bacterium]
MALEYNNTMLSPLSVKPVDYLVIGHVTKDLTPEGSTMGGTVAYAGLTARSLGLSVGVVTAWGTDISLEPLRTATVLGTTTQTTTTFANRETQNGRIQTLYHVAPPLNIELVPQIWYKTPIVHLGPVAQEVDPSLRKLFSAQLLCATPQGWLRDWDSQGHVRPSPWETASEILPQMDAVVLSIDDLAGDRAWGKTLASQARLMVITEGANGATVYWQGREEHIPAPTVHEVDPTGSGDIFAAAFFIHFHHSGDAWNAARFATALASQSVTRPGLAGVPTPQEVKRILPVTLTDEQELTN